MSVKGRLIAATALAAMGFVWFVWLWTLDVHVKEHNVDGVPAFCGSAYDVVLLKGNGHMGGEVPANQRAIDSVCVRKAGRDLVIGTIGGVLGVSTAAHVALPLGRRPVRLRETPSASVATDRP
jgi:hypothetical protein